MIPYLIAFYISGVIGGAFLCYKEMRADTWISNFDYLALVIFAGFWPVFAFAFIHGRIKGLFQ